MAAASAPGSNRAAANPALVEAKLRALARAASGEELAEVDAAVGVGAAVSGQRAFFLADNEPRAVGRALHWARSRHVDRVDILASGLTGDLARRAGLINATPGPSVGVWAVQGAQAAPAEPQPVAEPPALPDDHWALAGLITEAGARAIDDHGLLVAEVAGLEVARVVDAPNGGATLEVGVGQADRELSALVHTRDDVDEGLRRVVAAVVQHRGPQVASHHPLTRLARERWLRSVLLDQPSLVGATELVPLVPLRPRRGLVRNEPSAAVGRRADGRPVVVLTMVGVDLDLVPEAADYRQRWNPDAAIVLALPERDLELNTRLLGRLPDATALAVPVPWST